MRLRRLVDAVLVAAGSLALVLAVSQLGGSIPLGVVAFVAVLGAINVLHRRLAQQHALLAAQVAVARRSATRCAGPSVPPLTVSRRVRR